MTDTDRLREIITHIIRTGSISEMDALASEASAIENRIKVPLYIMMARIGDDRLYEQHGYASFAQFAKDRYDMDDSTAGHYRRLGAIMIEYEYELGDWLLDPNPELTKLGFLPIAVEHYGREGDEPFDNLRTMTLEDYRTFAETDPDRPITDVIPAELSDEEFEGCVATLERRGMSADPLREIYQIDAATDRLVLQADRLDDARSLEAVRLFRQSNYLAPSRTARVSEHLNANTFDRLLDAATSEDRELLHRAYRNDGTQYRLTPLLPRDDRKQLESLSLRAGVRNATVTHLEPVFASQSSADPATKPVFTVRTDFDL